MNNVETQLRPEHKLFPNYVPAPIAKAEWHFCTPPAGKELNLLTICGVSVVGNWCGKVGQYFTAWAPLVAQDEPSFTNLH